MALTSVPTPGADRKMATSPSPDGAAPSAGGTLLAGLPGIVGGLTGGLLASSSSTVSNPRAHARRDPANAVAAQQPLELRAPQPASQFGSGGLLQQRPEPRVICIGGQRQPLRRDPMHQLAQAVGEGDKLLGQDRIRAAEFSETDHEG